MLTPIRDRFDPPFQAQLNLQKQIYTPRFPPVSGETIFDIGGGNGYVSLGLMKAGFDVVLIEPGLAGATNAKRRGIRDVICATPDQVKIRNHSLPAIALFDVIEHLEDDLAFLKSMRALVKQGGFLYVTLPAYSFLWSDEDIQAGHFRRYTTGSICKIIDSAGFAIMFSSYIFRPLPVPIFLFRSLPYWLGLSRTIGAARKDLQHHVVKRGLASRVLSSLLQKEVKNLANNVSMHFGGSCLVVAKAR